jgi:hypothetical protein
MSSVLLNDPPAASPKPAPIAPRGVWQGTPAPTNDIPVRRDGVLELFRVSAASLATYGLLVAMLVVGKFYFLDHPTDFPLEAQASAFEWRALLAIASCGLVGLLLAPFARFPDMWDPRVGFGKRFLAPIVWGVVYGLVTVVRDLPDPSDVHLHYPASIPFYAYGAVFLEILLRLFGVTVITWLIGEVLFMGRLRGVAFWVANVVTSLYEPLPQIWEDLENVERPVQAPATVVNWAFQPLFLSNLLTGYLYRRFGFLTAVSFRLSFYAVWHVGYGNFRWEWLALR